MSSRSLEIPSHQHHHCYCHFVEKVSKSNNRMEKPTATTTTAANIESNRSKDEKSGESISNLLRDNNNMVDHHTSAQGVASGSNLVWYCPSRWLMAHHDPRANIYTLPSHLCLADLNNDGESLLALVDFKQRLVDDDNSRSSHTATTRGEAENRKPGAQQTPYECRLRVYRGQQLIYNHFLDDLPSCLLATSNSPLASVVRRRDGQGIDGSSSSSLSSSSFRREHECGRTLLTMAINDDVYFYHKLRPSHRLSLEDEPTIVETLNRSEYEAWKMVEENKVDVETLRELLISLSNELGSHELTSHSNNFLALNSNKERQEYLLLWKFKNMTDGGRSNGNHLMSMDTICCAAARLRYTSNVTRSGDFGQTRAASTLQLNSVRWNRVLDIQKDGLVLGTEDRHLLIYELRSTKSYLETSYRLPSTPDHILVERRSPTAFAPNSELKSLTYKILISCRNLRIYLIDQNYLVEKTFPLINNDLYHHHNRHRHQAKVKELLKLKCNVLDMCWIADEPSGSSAHNQPNFIVACLDRHIYCFSSSNGHCKWMVEATSQITSLISLPLPSKGPNESSLIGVALSSSRIDFFVSQTGRIVDSIYFNDDYCQAMTFGRFGREDNCLCLTTNLGHLLIFILKRTAKFANGQCLSSAASHASELISSCKRENSILSSTTQTSTNSVNLARNQREINNFERNSQFELNLNLLNEPANVPSAFNLSKSSSANLVDQVMERILHSDHNCDQVIDKKIIDAQLQSPELTLPSKNRDFVDQVMEQSRSSLEMSRLLAKHFVKLRDKTRDSIKQQSQLDVTQISSENDGSRLLLNRVTGLGNTYRVSMSLRLDLKRYAERHHLLSSSKEKQLINEEEEEEEVNSFKLNGCKNEETTSSKSSLLSEEEIVLTVLLFVGNENENENGQQQCQVKPFKFELVLSDHERSQWILERSLDFKLQTGINSNLNYSSKQQQQRQEINNNNNNNSSGATTEDSISMDIYVVPLGSDFWRKRISADELRRPVFISSVNIPTC